MTLEVGSCPAGPDDAIIATTGRSELVFYSEMKCARTKSRSKSCNRLFECLEQCEEGEGNDGGVGVGMLDGHFRGRCETNPMRLVVNIVPNVCMGARHAAVGVRGERLRGSRRVGKRLKGSNVSTTQGMMSVKSKRGEN
jgi:hypothetical protein